MGDNSRKHRGPKCQKLCTSCLFTKPHINQRTMSQPGLHLTWNAQLDFCTEAGWQIILAQCAKKCAKLIVPKFLAHVPKIKCVKLIVQKFLAHVLKNKSAKINVPKFLAHVPKNKCAKINVPKFLAHLFLAHFL